MSVMLTEAGRFLRRIVLPLAILTFVMVGLGLLITKSLDGVWPFTIEDDLDRTFAEHRSGAGTTSPTCSPPWPTPV